MRVAHSVRELMLDVVGTEPENLVQDCSRHRSEAVAAHLFFRDPSPLVALKDSQQLTVSDGNALGTLLVQVLDNSTIKMEFFKSAPIVEVSGFTSAAVVYRR